MDTSNWWKGLAFGAFSSMVADCLTLPIDVTKTRLQISGAGGTKLYDGIFDCVGRSRSQIPYLRNLCTREGFQGPLDKGVAPGLFVGLA